MSAARTSNPESPDIPVSAASPMTSVLSPALSVAERRSLRRAVGLLNLDRSRFILAVLTGTAAMASAVSRITSFIGVFLFGDAETISARAGHRHRAAQQCAPARKP